MFVCCYLGGGFCLYFAACFPYWYHSWREEAQKDFDLRHLLGFPLYLFGDWHISVWHIICFLSQSFLSFDSFAPEQFSSHFYFQYQKALTFWWSTCYLWPFRLKADSAILCHPSGPTSPSPQDSSQWFIFPVHTHIRHCLDWSVLVLGFVGPH